MDRTERVLARFHQLGKFLETKGFPATSPWWESEIQRWYRSGKRQFVPRAGRRGGKSSTLSRLGVTEALYGEHVIPPGDVGVVAIISTRAPEAEERLRTIKAILDALRVKYKPATNGIELVGKRIAFRVHVATIAGVSGFTGIFVLCDEVAKWRDLDTGTNPATEVIRSVRPTLATQPYGKIVLSSSPLGTLDAHYDAFEAGETELQCTAQAPTWMANPSPETTEEQTRILEPDETTWQREYAAIPQAEAESSLLSAVKVDEALKRASPHEPHPRFYYVATIDPATRRNAWTFSVSTQDEHGVFHVVHSREWMGSPKRPLVSGQVFRDIKTDLVRFNNLTHVWSDQYAADPLKEIARNEGLYLHTEPWTTSMHEEAYENLKVVANQDRLTLTGEKNVRNDLLGIRTVITRSGLRYDLLKQGQRHSDFAPCIAMGILKARVRAKPLEPEKNIEQLHREWRDNWLAERKRDREREERLDGRKLPATHRMQPKGRRIA